LRATECGGDQLPRLQGRQDEPESTRALPDEVLLAEIKRIHVQDYAIHEFRMLDQAMWRAGMLAGSARLMKAAGLEGVGRGCKPVTTRPAGQVDHRPDLVQHRFNCQVPASAMGR